MKKILLFSFFIFSSLVSMRLFGDSLEEQDTHFMSALTAGYVFKNNDCVFENVYGKGMVNVITADGCYHHCQQWGIGAKISYWRAKGRTTFLGQRTTLQELPVTFYLRRMKEFKCGRQVYASLGGGIVWIKEKSYLGNVQMTKGIGEAEIGFNCPMWRCLDFTAAFRYLFPRQSHCCEKMNVGGFDLRAGIGLSL